MNKGAGLIIFENLDTMPAGRHPPREKLSALHQRIGFRIHMKTKRAPAVG